MDFLGWMCPPFQHRPQAFCKENKAIFNASLVAEIYWYYLNFLMNCSYSFVNCQNNWFENRSQQRFLSIRYGTLRVLDSEDTAYLGRLVQDILSTMKKFKSVNDALVIWRSAVWFHEQSRANYLNALVEHLREKWTWTQTLAVKTLGLSVGNSSCLDACRSDLILTYQGRWIGIVYHCKCSS